MKEKLLAGAPCDVILLTQPLLDALVKDGYVREATIRPLGRVFTGIAVRSGDAPVVIGTAESLRETLRTATSVYLPDPDKSTAGVHFMSVLEKLGIDDEHAARLKPRPNGAIAMAGLARAIDERPIGCTQVSEIMYTPGVALAGVLPKAFELATLYSAAVATSAVNAALGERFVEMVSGPESSALRAAGGFEL